MRHRHKEQGLHKKRIIFFPLSGTFWLRLPPPPLPVLQVTDEVTEELRSFFRPHNEDLEKLLGMPLPAAWKQ